MNNNISTNSVQASVRKCTRDSVWKTVGHRVWLLSDYEIWDSREDVVAKSITLSIRNPARDSVIDYFKLNE